MLEYLTNRDFDIDRAHVNSASSTSAATTAGERRNVSIRWRDGGANDDEKNVANRHTGHRSERQRFPWKNTEYITVGNDCLTLFDEDKYRWWQRRGWSTLIRTTRRFLAQTQDRLLNREIWHNFYWICSHTNFDYIHTQRSTAKPYWIDR